MHELGIMHRDVKPGNVLVSPDGHLAFTDFGLSYAPQIHEPRFSRGYGASYRVGTPGYWAPEVRAHLPGVWQSSDIFSLAIVFIELALDKGEAFYVGQTEEELNADMDETSALTLPSSDSPVFGGLASAACETSTEVLLFLSRPSWGDCVVETRRRWPFEGRNNEICLSIPSLTIASRS